MGSFQAGFEQAGGVGAGGLCMSRQETRWSRASARMQVSNGANRVSIVCSARHYVTTAIAFGSTQTSAAKKRCTPKINIVFKWPCN